MPFGAIVPALPPDPLRIRALGMRDRLADLIAALGTEISYAAGSLNVNVPARISVMSGSVRFARFRADTTSTWALPAFVVTVAGDFRPFGAEPQTGDAVALTGESSGLTVRRVEKIRLAGIVVRTVLYVARDV
jgi:hypothetical protein